MLAIVLICVTIFAVGLVARGYERSWVGPTAFFALVWWSYPLVSSLWVTEPDSYRLGLYWICWSVFVMLLGSMSAQLFVPPIVARDMEPSPAAARILRWVCVTICVAGALNIVWLFLGRGFALRDIVSFVVLAQYTAKNRAEAMAGEIDTPIPQRLLFVSYYLNAAYGGVLFRLARQRLDRVVGVLAMVGIAALFALLGSRQGILYGGSMWLSAYLGTHVLLSDPVKGVNARFLVRFGLTGAVILLGLSTLSMALRYSATQKLNWFTMVADPFGYVISFGIWFQRSGMWFDNLFYGGRMFLRPMAFFGITYEPQPAIEWGYSSSNLYTVFRDLIEDFNPVGSSVFLFLLGFVGRRVFAATSAGSQRAFPALVFIYAFIVTSVTSGLLMYTSTTVAMFLFLVTCRYFPPLVRERAS